MHTPDQKPKNRLWTLFTSMLAISSFTFGGGFVIVTLMKRRFVDELGWMDEDEMLDIAAMAQSTPGAIAVNAAVLTGTRIGGTIGMFVAVIGGMWIINWGAKKGYTRQKMDSSYVEKKDITGILPAEQRKPAAMGISNPSVIDPMASVRSSRSPIFFGKRSLKCSHSGSGSRFIPCASSWEPSLEWRSARRSITSILTGEV